MIENVNILIIFFVILLCYQVIVFVYDGLCIFEFGVVVEIFGLLCLEMGDNWYQFVVVVVDEGLLCVIGGICLMIDGGFEFFVQVDMIVVFGWCGVDVLVFEVLCVVLVFVYVCGCWIIFICFGVFVFVVFGLFNGCQVIIYWCYIVVLQFCFLQIQVVEDVFYVGDVLLMIFVGSVVGIDFCLYLVCEDFGSEVVNVVVCCLVVFFYCDGGQVQQVLCLVVCSWESLCFGQLFDYLYQYFVVSYIVVFFVQCVGMGMCIFLCCFEEVIGKMFVCWLLEE